MHPISFFTSYYPLKLTLFLHFLVAKYAKVVYSMGAIGHMAELVDALVSGTSGATLGSSSLLMPTTV